MATRALAAAAITAYGMVMRGSVAATCFVIALMLCTFTAVGGDGGVVRVGPRQLTAADIERRWNALPPFQRRALAAESPDFVSDFVSTVIVREVLFSQAASDRHLTQEPTAKARTNAILVDALLERVEADALAARPVTAADVREYYDAHRDRFVTPEAIRIWRVLVADEATARQAIATARGVDGPRHWSEFAREHSKDKATAMRKGDLGFVRADGSTDVPRVRVAPELYAAAAELVDGRVAQDPVPEGKYLAVVWRRGTRAGRDQPLEEVESDIRQSLARVRRERALHQLLESLRKQHLRDLDPSPLQALDTLPLPSARALPPPILSARAARHAPRPTGSAPVLR